MMHVDQRAIDATLFLIGFTLWDFILWLFIIRDYTKHGYEIYFHHFIVTVGATTSLYTGSGVLNCINNQHPMEISTLFLNYRSMMMNEEDCDMKSFLFTFNQIIFFVIYTLTRIIMYPLSLQ